jgi:sugar lactone lactonase YvrE
MQLETLVTGWKFLEAPRVDADDNLYFTDITLGGLHKRYPDGRIESFLTDRTWIGGIAFNDDGRVVCAGRKGMILFDEKTGESRPLLDELDGQPCGAVNDMYPDGEGGIIAGLIDAKNVGAGRPAEPRPIIRLSPSGKVTRMAEGIGVPNGIGFSPDRRTLYLSESYKALWAFDVDAGLNLSNKRLFADIKDADGLSVDAEGDIWVARFDSWGVTRYRPDGSVHEHIETPVKEVQSISFGGKDLRDVYIVTGSSYADPVNLKELTGTIYRGRSDVPGQTLPPTRFR